MKKATINASNSFAPAMLDPHTKTGFYNEIQAPKVKISVLEVFHRALWCEAVATLYAVRVIVFCQ